MKASPHMQAWIDQTRKEPLRMCDWKLLRRLALLIGFCLLSGFIAEFLLTSRSLAAALYALGGCASFVLLAHGRLPAPVHHEACPLAWPPSLSGALSRLSQPQQRLVRAG